jgi:hypothetical protein
MNTKSRSKLSELKKEVCVLRERRKGYERIMMREAPMVAASMLCRKIGDTGREMYVLSGSANGASVHRYVRKEEIGKWKIRAENWRKFSRAMIEWVKAGKETEKKLREIGRQRCERMPGKKIGRE